jgi:hypothetical protein
MNKIYIRHWLTIKPYDGQKPTDGYYLKICNRVKNKIDHFILFKYIGEEDINTLACFLTSYFEDIISETNIWSSFVSIHQRMYKKQLPFYDLEDYVEKEINTQDIRVLIWYFLNTAQDEFHLSYSNQLVIKMADSVMEVFEEEWEHAPANDSLKAYYWISPDETDFYAARNFIDKILFQSYLFHIDALVGLHEKELEIIEENESHPNLISFLNENRDTSLHVSHTRLLALTGKEWASEVLGSDHPLYSDLLNMSKKISGHFLYKGQDEADVHLAHIATGKKFKLTKKSFSYGNDLSEIDTIVFMGIVKWKEEWWFSGVFFSAPYDEELVAKEKNSLEHRRELNFLDDNSAMIQKILAEQMEAFLELNHGSQIAFMPTEKIDGFLRAFTNRYNEKLNLTEQQQREVYDKMIRYGLDSTEKDNIDLSEISDTGLVFFNPVAGCEICVELNSAFPLPNNPYFDRNLSEDHVMSLLIDKSCSKELVQFCIDNCLKELPFLKQSLGLEYQNDLDFLLRFWKNQKYHSNPTVTIG